MEYHQAHIKLQHSGITGCIGFSSSGVDPHSLSTDFLTTFTRYGLSVASALFNAAIMMGAIRGKMENDKYRFNYGNFLELLVLWSGYCLSWPVALWVWCCLGNHEKTPLFLPQCLREVSCLCSDVFLFILSSVVVGEQTCFNRVAAFHLMPRLCHRMRSHRGTPRRVPSRMTSTSPSLSSDLTSVHYPHTHSGRRHIHLPNHHPPDSSPSPSFGSAIFSFNCTQNHPRITAHISVIFHEEAQEVGESNAQQEGLASIFALNPLTVQVPEIPIHFASDVVMEMAPGPSDVAPITCTAAHNIGFFFVHVDKWIHTCKIWFNLHVSLNFCKHSQKVNTCSPALHLNSSSPLSSLSWTVSLLFSAAPTG